MKRKPLSTDIIDDKARFNPCSELRRVMNARDLNTARIANSRSNDEKEGIKRVRISFNAYDLIEALLSGGYEALAERYDLGIENVRRIKVSLERGRWRLKAVEMCSCDPL